jgi:antitoxin VapB
MTWNIENRETEKLAAEVAEMAGETKEGAVHEALREKKERLEMRIGRKPKRDLEDLRKFMEREIWSQIPDELLDQEPMSKKEIEDLLGYGEGGV